jgi:hypothetical protein
MSLELINHSRDLKQLRDEGYELEIKGGHLLVHHVPYVNAKMEIKYGTLVSNLTLASPDKTAKPSSHVIFFIGEHPCNHDGSVLRAIQSGSCNQCLDSTHYVIVNHSFSNKPANGFNDYYEKITSYIRVISSQAEFLDRDVTAKTFKIIESKETESVFKYFDTNSSRAQVHAISSKLEGLRIAIVGLGGTGAYILDFVAKTPVKEIHLFDDDPFLQHNAFRAPGAASVAQLSAQAKKVTYLEGIYSNMRNFIIPHPYCLDSSNANELDGMSFVFISIDKGQPKKAIIDRLIDSGVPFIDTGIGVEVVDNALTGSIRVTTSTQNKREHIKNRISFDDDGNDAYGQNVQIAELNALNAAMAVIKWKKLFGFYHDLEMEHNAIYAISVNQVVTDETDP